ncbi:MAG: cobalt ECF transporter T component CbiQ [Nitrospirota bacterium]
MHLEEFAWGDTLVHRLDPRVKLLTAMPLAILVALLQGLGGPARGLALSAALVALARLNIRKVLARLLVVNVFVLMLWAFLPFTHPGEEVFAIGPLSASREGLLLAASITLKTNAIVLATMALLGTSQVMDLAHALVHMRFPAKLVHLFFFFYRYLGVLHEEYARLRTAMRVRAFSPRTSAHTYRSFGWLLGMLLVRSYERSERIYRAMLCRGFHGHFPVLHHFRLRAADLAFALAMALSLAVVWRGI